MDKASPSGGEDCLFSSTRAAFYSLVTHYVAWELLVIVVDDVMRALGTVDRIVGRTVWLFGWFFQRVLRLQ